MTRSLTSASLLQLRLIAATITHCESFLPVSAASDGADLIYRLITEPGALRSAPHVGAGLMVARNGASTGVILSKHLGDNFLLHAPASRPMSGMIWAAFCRTV